MNASIVILLVTWLIPGQPPNSYQTSFASIEDCENSRAKIFQDAQRMNAESRSKWTPVVGTTVAATLDASVSAVCTGSDAKAYTGTNLQVMTYEAYRWARVAAELGDAEAQAKVGADLIDNKELKWMTDTVEGLRWLDRSAQHGCFNGLLFLSMIYRDGASNPSRPDGYVPQDYVEALKWFNIAISRKDVKQCNMLFDYYHGGPRNLADLNRDPLKEQYDFLVGKMPPAQIAEAQRKAREWRPIDEANRQAWDRNEVTNGTLERP